MNKKERKDWLNKHKEQFEKEGISLIPTEEYFKLKRESITNKGSLFLKLLVYVIIALMLGGIFFYVTTNDYFKSNFWCEGDNITNICPEQKACPENQQICNCQFDEDSIRCPDVKVYLNGS